MSEIGFLKVPEHSTEAQEIFDEDMDELGFVMNVSKLWAYQPATLSGLFDLLQGTTLTHRFTLRQRGILIAACASTLGDAYCSLGWGSKLAKESDAETAAGVLRGDDDRLADDEVAMAEWARKVTRDPNHTNSSDIESLRKVGFSGGQIFAMTTYVALRIAFSTVNDALGVRPDADYRSSAPDKVLDAVTFGRPIDGLDIDAGGNC
jgi:alkylhydroperoxidase family enzyme